MCQDRNIIIPPFEISELEKRMRPGVLSEFGFLGPNESLVEIVSNDNATLINLEVNHNEIGSALGSLLKRAILSGKRRYSDRLFKVRVTVYPGFQICPWSTDIHHAQCDFGGGVEYGSTDWQIKNKVNGLKLKGSGLLVHLIRDHHFFEGKKSPYRIEPVLLARLLNLIP